MSLLKPTLTPQYICGISYVFLLEVQSAIKVNSTSIVVTLKSNKIWKPVYFTPGTISYEEKQNITASGNSYSKELKFNYPDKSKESILDFGNLAYQPCLIRYKYSDGSYMLMGDLNYPALLNILFTSNIKTTTAATFYSNSPERALFYYSTMEEIPIDEDQGTITD